MFNEANSVEDFIRDRLCNRQPPQTGRVRDVSAPYGITKPASTSTWQYIPSTQLPRTESDVLIESHLRDALIRLNPEIAQKPDRANEVLYRLRTILLSVNTDGLVRANEEFAAWLRGDRTMPVGPNNSTPKSG